MTADTKPIDAKATQAVSRMLLDFDEIYRKGMRALVEDNYNFAVLGSNVPGMIITGATHLLLEPFIALHNGTDKEPHSYARAMLDGMIISLRRMRDNLDVFLTDCNKLRGVATND